MWPVGAVSKTTQVNSSASACRMISANVIASSMPGRESEMSLTKPVRLAPKPPAEPPAPSASAPLCMACWKDLDAFGSISMQKRLSKPSTAVGLCENFWRKASLEPGRARAGVSGDRCPP